MKEELRIYSSNAYTVYETEIKRLKEWKTSPRNKELITRFHNFLFASGTKQGRVAKVSGQLRRIALLLEKDFDKATKDDLQNLVARYNTLETISEATKSDYRRCIKQFYKWFEEEDSRVDSDDKELRLDAKNVYKYAKSIKRAYKNKELNFSNILTDDNIDLIVENGCKTLKEKALLRFLHETGVRVGELLMMKTIDIEVKDNYAMARVDGKTGERRIPILSSIPSILKWLEIHPFKNNQNTYLWLGESRRYKEKPLKYAGCCKLIKRCFERAGMIHKKHNPHWFRHSRATLLAPKLTESLLCKYMGWELGSNQVKTYVHLCTKQLEDSFLKAHGMKSIEENKDKPIKCICGTLNNPKERYCFKCYRPLNIDVAIQDKEIVNSEINKTVQFMMEMTKNPELMKKFEEFKKLNKS